MMSIRELKKLLRGYNLNIPVFIEGDNGGFRDIVDVSCEYVLPYGNVGVDGVAPHMFVPEEGKNETGVIKAIILKKEYK